MSLLLESYFFPEISIAANTAFDREDDGYDPEKCHFEGTLEFEGTGHIRSNFLFRVDAQSDNSMPYEIRIHAFAAFEIVSDLITEDVKYVEAFNGRMNVLKRSAVGMVYGALRELVASISGRQPWGGFMIPTIMADDADIELVLSDELKAFQASLKSVHDSADAKARATVAAPVKAPRKR